MQRIGILKSEDEDAARIGASVLEPARPGERLRERDTLRLEIDFLILTRGAQRREAERLIQCCHDIPRP